MANAGRAIGYAAVQIPLTRGLRVIATAGATYAQRLRDLGAALTSYGDGRAERVREISGDPKRVLTISGFAAAAELGVRDTFHEDRTQAADVLPEFARLAADGKLAAPAARTFPRGMADRPRDLPERPRPRQAPAPHRHRRLTIPAGSGRPTPGG